MPSGVIPAKAGIHPLAATRVPASAGTTSSLAHLLVGYRFVASAVISVGTGTGRVSVATQSRMSM